MITLCRISLRALLSSAVALVPLVAGAQEDAQRPEFGGGVSIKTISNTAFSPADPESVANMARSTKGNGTVCTNITGGTCSFSSGIELPTGARVVGLDLVSCDSAAGGAAVLTLFDCVLNGTTGPCPDAATATVTSGGGCTINSAAVDLTIQNATHYYPLFVRITDNSIGVLFQSVRIRYQLQVSAPPGTATFSDVPTTHIFFPFIEALVQSGITGGCGTAPLRFCPADPVTRGQMAAFLAIALGLHFPN